jgi:hypothetical protein
VSKHFERWKELAALCLREQDPVKLSELAQEMNLALQEKTPMAGAASEQSAELISGGISVFFESP